MEQKQIDNYLENHGVRCPYCSGRDLDSGAFHSNDSVVWQEIFCENCGRKWRDVYELKTIEEEEPAE